MTSEFIENRTFDEIQIGDSASLERRLTLQDIKLFAVMSGNVNPAHVDEDYAKSSRFHEVIAHGLWGGTLISAVLGTQLPGSGTIYLNQSLSFRRPVGLGDLVRVSVTLKEKHSENHRLLLDCLCANEEGKTVISGEAEILAPTEKVKRPRWVLPEIHMSERVHLHRLLAAAKERRLSHVFAFDVPTYAQPLFITDAAINVSPTLEHKRDIVQNAIDLAHALRIERPKVAVLSAVETITPIIPSTLDAAALWKMADRGRLSGAVVDGPLAFDNAVSPVAARIKGIVSPVAGQANILVVPDLEAGNMLAKQLEYLGGAEGAGIALGARVPIVLTSRADDTITRLASCALAVMLVHHRREALA